MCIKKLEKTDEIIVLTKCPECGEEKEHVVFLNSEEWYFQYNKGIICCENCQKAYRFKRNINHLKKFFN